VIPIELTHKKRSSVTMRLRIFYVIQILGAYGVRYFRDCGIICGFSIAETENQRKRFLLGRALETEGSEPF